MRMRRVIKKANNVLHGTNQATEKSNTEQELRTDNARRQSDDHLNNDKDLPILRIGKTNWTKQELVDLLIKRNSSRICTKRPSAPQLNCSLLVDTTKLEDREDWKTDDSGSWRNCGSSGRIVTVEHGKVTHSMRMPRTVSKRPNLKQNQYVFTTTYFRHLNYPDYKRNSIIGFDSNDIQLDLIIIEYFFTGTPHKVSPKKHGNSKGSAKFLPTSASTKKRLVSATSKTSKGPLSVFDEVSEDVGGLEGTKAASDIPRSIDQVRYIRKTLRQKDKVDEISELIDKANSLPDNVRCVQLTPSIRFIVSTAQTFINLSNFCTKYENCTPFCVDTTYGVGKFFVTTTSYKNLKLLNKSNNEHPSFPGPALFHVDQDESVFCYFAQTIIACKNDLKSVLFVGSDRDRALINGMSNHFLIATNLYCKKHVEDDIRRKLATLPHLTSAVKKTILSDIFGSERKEMKGLIDCENEKDLDELSYLCCLKWDKLECQCDKSQPPKVSRYFKRFIEQDMKNGMILSKRRLAGLGDNFFYNNSTEPTNFRFKNKIRQKKTLSETSGQPSKQCSLSEAIEIYKDFLEEYNRNAQRAIIGVGPYKLAPKFESFLIPAGRWAQMTTDERRRKIALFNDACMPMSLNDENSDHLVPDHQTANRPSDLDLHENNVEESSSILLDDSQSQSSHHSNNFLNFSETGLSKNYQIDWKGALSILKDNAALKCPWNDGSYIVRSDSNTKISHSVIFSSQKATVQCDCPRFKFHSICKHAISVAHLESFLEQLINKWKPNLSRQLQGTVPSNAGQKKSDRRRTRNPTSQRSVQNFTCLPQNQQNLPPDDDSLKVIFLAATKARVCYGCGSNIRSKDDVRLGNVPPIPYDMVITRRERRVFMEKGSQTIKIAKTKENVYYHPKRTCLLNKLSSVSPVMFEIEDDIRTKLTTAHQNLLNAEFRIRFS